MTIRIPIGDIPGFRIGHAQDEAGATGCTVILCGDGAAAGVDVRGGGPASRETDLLNPVASADAIHALVLSGGSAFGLEAAGGVMHYLKERDIGFDTGVAKVPLVCQSCLFDLQVGSSGAWPDAAMAYAACLDAEKNETRRGNVGAGTGATVGKFRGVDAMMKSGLGVSAVAIGDFKMGAIVAVNALGDIFDAESGRRLAGMLAPDGESLADTEEAMLESIQPVANLFTGNTTIGAILTNARFDKTELTKIAAMAHNGYARSIRPVHTMADGDSIYALSSGDVAVDINVAGTLAATVMSRAITDAVLSAEPAYGLKTARMLQEAAR